MAESSNVGVAEPDPLRRRPLRRILRNWLKRHRNRFNFWIHMLGIPTAVAGVVLLMQAAWYRDGVWALWGLGLFVAGYVLQFWGHAVEGNEVGEWVAIKKALGLPYVAVAPAPDAPGRHESPQGR